MDALGFVFATTFLATVFAVFGVIGRIIDGVVDGLRYSVAPTMIGGFTAWEQRRSDASAAATAPAGSAAPDDGSDAGGAPGDAGSPALDVPVRPIVQRGWHRFGVLMHARVARGHVVG